MLTRRSVVHQLLSLAALSGVSAAGVETYPARRVKIITTVAPGGTVDVLARLIAQKLCCAAGCANTGWQKRDCPSLRLPSCRVS